MGKDKSMKINAIYGLSPWALHKTPKLGPVMDSGINRPGLPENAHPSSWRAMERQMKYLIWQIGLEVAKCYWERETKMFAYSVHITITEYGMQNSPTTSLSLSLSIYLSKMH